MEICVDLVDDIWLRIFFSFGTDRAKYAQVSKRWKNIILSPHNWKTLGYDIVVGFSGGDNAPRRSLSFLAFIKSHLSGLVDVNVNIHSTQSFDTVLDTFLQIKTLRRLRLLYHFIGIEYDLGRTSNSTYKSTLVPQCTDLVLLNLSNLGFEAQISSEGVANIVKGAPNLEELYLGTSYQESVSVLYPLKKLQRVLLDSVANIDELVKHLPQLKYIITAQKKRETYSFAKVQDDECSLREIGSTVVVGDNYMNAQNIDLVRKLKDLVTIDHSQYFGRFASEFTMDPDFMSFMVKELHLDINYQLQPRPQQCRPFTNNANLYKNALSAVLQEGAPYQMGASEMLRSQLLLLLRLGADPNTIVTVSPLDVGAFGAVADEDCALLLLEYGYNIHVIEERRGKKIPRYFDVLYTKIPKSVRLLEKVLEQIDVNKDFDGYTLLQHAIYNHKEYAIKILTKAGATWTAGALEELFRNLPNVFDKLTVQGAYDFRLLSPSVIFKALERGLLPELKEVVQTLPDGKDLFGLTPLHRAALLREFKAPFSVLKSDREKGTFERWLGAEKPVFGFGSSSVEADATRFITPAIDTAPSGGLSTDAGGSGWVGNGSENSFGVQNDNGFNGLNFGNNSGAESLFGNTAGNDNGFNIGSNNSNPGSFGSHIGNDSGFTFGNNAGYVGNDNGINFGNNDIISFALGGNDVTSEEDTVSRNMECRLSDVLPLLVHCDINARSFYGETPLLLLIKSDLGQLKLQNVKLLLENGADVNIADNNGWTPLHAALYSGLWQIVSELTSHGANVNAQDRIGITPLMALLIGFVHNQTTVDNNISDEWSKLMTLAVDVSLVDKTFNRTLMHYVACVGSANEAQLIFDKGPKLVNALDIDGNTPLHYAAMFSNAAMVKFLLEQGANPNAQSNYRNITPAMLAAHLKPSSFQQEPLRQFIATQNLLLLASSMLTEGSDPGITRRFIEPPWTTTYRGSCTKNHANVLWRGINVDVICMLIPVSDVHLKDVRGSTLLHHLAHIAAGKHANKYPILEAITARKELMQYWSVPEKSQAGDTPFETLLGNTRTFGSFINPATDSQLLELLVSVCKEHQIKFYNDDYDRSLIGAVFCLDPNARSKLLPLIDFSKLPTEFRVNAVVEQRSTLLHPMISMGSDISFFEEVLKLQPLALNTQNSAGETLLFSAVSVLLTQSYMSAPKQVFHFVELIDLLLSQKDIDVHKPDNEGNTPLHRAVAMFHLGAIDAKNGNLRFSFIFAAPYCIVAFKLLEAGARVDCKNNAGETPCDYCPRLVEFFKEYHTLVNEEWIAAYAAYNTNTDETKTPIQVGW